jgi:hypothetical protein
LVPDSVIDEWDGPDTLASMFNTTVQAEEIISLNSQTSGTITQQERYNNEREIISNRKSDDLSPRRLTKLYLVKKLPSTVCELKHSPEKECLAYNLTIII